MVILICIGKVNRTTRARLSFKILAVGVALAHSSSDDSLKNIDGENFIKDRGYRPF